MIGTLIDTTLPALNFSPRSAADGLRGDFRAEYCAGSERLETLITEGNEEIKVAAAVRKSLKAANPQ